MDRCFKNHLRTTRKNVETDPHGPEISAEKFNEYFEGCECAYAYQLGKVHRYRTPKSLEDFGLSALPQSFAYVE